MRRKTVAMAAVLAAAPNRFILAANCMVASATRYEDVKLPLT